MKLFSSLFIAFFAIVSVLTFQSCKEDAVEDKTVIGTAAKDTDFTIFLQAINRVGLTETLKGSGPFTVFAPTNAAFATFLTANNWQSLTDIPLATLEKVLLNHVVSGKVMSSQLTTGYVTTLAKYGTTANGLSMFVNTSGGIALNGGATNGGASVASADANIEASNGVIHKIRTVMGLPTVVNHAIANPNFTTLVGQLSRNDLGANLVSTLSSSATPAPFTVFAPTNTAFTNFETERSLTLSSVAGTTVAGVLLYHVASGANVRSSNLSNNQPVTTMAASNNSFTVNISGSSVTIRDSAPTPRTTNVVATDVQANNGVIHVVDRVLLNF